MCFSSVWTVKVEHRSNTHSILQKVVFRFLSFYFLSGGKGRKGRDEILLDALFHNGKRW